MRPLFASLEKCDSDVVCSALPILWGVLMGNSDEPLERFLQYRENHKSTCVRVLTGRILRAARGTVVGFRRYEIN